MQTAVLEAQLEQEKMLQERQRWETELAWKSKMSDADRAAKLLEINSRHEIEMAKLREGGQLEKEIAAAKIESDREIKVVSLEAKREEKQRAPTDDERGHKSGPGNRGCTEGGQGYRRRPRVDS